MLSVKEYHKKSGQAFEKLILDNKLGEVTRSHVRKNPNTRRMVAGFIWSVDYEALKKWYKENTKVVVKKKAVKKQTVLIADTNYTINTWVGVN